jgi:hypothetical protein
MSINEQDRLEELRKRLYERGNAPEKREPHHLSDTHEEVRESWERPPQPPRPLPQPAAPAATDTMARTHAKRGYRMKILLGGFAIFVLTIAVSSLFLAFGRHNISGDNITISASGPFTIGGGQEFPLQVGITNSNTVPIDSATLIVEYPSGTQSATEEGKELFTERQQLETINSGETVNIPLKAKVFGEENEEKTIKVSIEYRVSGSNATFYKEADPLRFKISSSPVIIRADTIKKISSGQESEVTLTIISNSPTPLSQVLVKAEYPVGFDFSSADPKPTYGQNGWLITDLQPEKEKTITISGIVVGKESDEYAINFSVGVPNERDPQSLASIFAKTQTQFQIEQPFLDIDLQVNNSSESEVAVEPGRRSNAVITFTNTLEDTVYDISVEVELSGNAFSIYEVGPSSGYFDPSKNTITWDVSNTPSLRQATPGEKKQLSFSLEAASQVTNTPQVNIKVNTHARRVSENDVAEQLIGTAESTLKVISVPVVRAQASHDTDVFVDTGPVPPVVDKETTYTIAMQVKNGSNGVSDALVSASLPAYVTWLNQTAGTGDITYNPTTRAIEWSAGDIDANAEVYAAFQVSVLPRSLQIGTVPVLLTEQRIRAVDKFTGTVVRGSNPPITTKLPADDPNDPKAGVVRASESN